MNDIFEVYLREKEPQKKEKGYAWHTAIGLQAVDGLKTSDYLIDTAKRNIEGDITFEEADRLIHSYYKENISHTGMTERKKQTRFQCALHSSFRKSPLLCLLLNIYQFMQDFLKAFTSMQAKSEIIT